MTSISFAVQTYLMIMRTGDSGLIQSEDFRLIMMMMIRMMMVMVMITSMTMATMMMITMMMRDRSLRDRRVACTDIFNISHWPNYLTMVQIMTHETRASYSQTKSALILDAKNTIKNYTGTCMLTPAVINWEPKNTYLVQILKTYFHSVKVEPAKTHRRKLHGSCGHDRIIMRISVVYICICFV